jgi:uncharacterized membrane protein
MVIVFPIGLWIFSLIADLIFLAGGQPVWNAISFYTMIGGFIGALAAAIPGLIDFWAIVDAAAKRVAFYHMIINLAVVAAYGLNLYLRSNTASPAGLPLALSIIAVLLLSVSGWLGGELVYVHGLGVKGRGPRPPTLNKNSEETRLRRVP